jgi:hypothetical protein
VIPIEKGHCITRVLAIYGNSQIAFGAVLINVRHALNLYRHVHIFIDCIFCLHPFAFVMCLLRYPYITVSTVFVCFTLIPRACLFELQLFKKLLQESWLPEKDVADRLTT